ncbi:MAG: phosphoenolpyruvate---glycerone phosphotransferase subunit DhaL [Chloroflexota bacterium]|nr:phosphoenolpyruvate---glycerone phosphotransferase subunit DhaL [Chloroflexota bacterium]
MTISNDDVIKWLQAYDQVIADNKEYLTELDSIIGDADHGANMFRGFQAVMKKLSGVQDKDIGAIFKTVGMTLLSTVGGAGGPLYSTLFIQAGNRLNGKMELTLSDWAEALEAANGGIMRLGKAVVGDKTMVDALVPAVQALQDASKDGKSMDEALQMSADAAKKGMESTIPLVARKGRASYLGERSAGHQDPGATSSYLLLKTAVDVWTQK